MKASTPHVMLTLLSSYFANLFFKQDTQKKGEKKNKLPFSASTDHGANEVAGGAQRSLIGTGPLAGTPVKYRGRA